MKLKNMKKEELELLSYTDLTEIILAENNKAMNTPAIFRRICELLDLSDEEYTTKIGDFYTSLTTDKRFLLLDSAEWDLRDRHAVKIELDIEEDEEEEEEVTDEDIIDKDLADDIEEPLEDDDLDDNDDIEDLAILNDSDLDDEN